MIEINIGATVESGGRDVGRVERVILDRDNFEATHLVVRHGGALNPVHVLMPLGWIAGSEHDKVLINRAPAELENLPRFEIQHYVRLDELDQEQLEHPRSKIKPSDWINYFVPLVANAFGDPLHTPGIVVTDQMLAPNESAIRRGLPVESSDFHKIGEVHEVTFSEPDWRLSGLIIARGVMVMTYHMKIPADWVARLEKDRILLNRSKEQIEDWEKQQK
ncbi:MAG: hypothetical protein IPM66_17520 [Acidobacteriota bacterium]|nr:MAG: hypothetical protein IPM66_17520 [Acidobacteriota bacterium]